jgi:hypothetical protein
MAASFPMMRKQPALAIMLGGFVVLAVGVGAIALLPEQPSRPVRATITGATFVMMRYTIYEHVALRSDDGRTGTVSFRPSEFSCHVGDTVDAEEVGVNLRLRPGVCRHGPPSPWAPSPGAG